MADNTTLPTGSGGDVIATDDIGGVKHQRVKIEHGADGSATDVSSASPLPVLLDAATLAALETIGLDATTLTALETITIGTALPAGTNAIGTVLAPKTSTVTTGAGTANSTTTSSEAVATNSSRTGLSVINDSDTIVYLGIGATAVANRGIRLNANGGSWDGRIGNVTWTGAVNSIHAGSGTKILAYIEL